MRALYILKHGHTRQITALITSVDEEANSARIAHVILPSSQPSMIFIGVTTGQSSINAVFPQWAEVLGLGNCALRGVDLPLHAEPERYREVIDFLRRDRLSLGALVTSHKMDLFAACQDQFDVIDPLALEMGEISSIYKCDGQLHGRTVDPVNSGLALEAFLPPNHWAEKGAEALILGAGGSALALSWYLARPSHGANRPAKIHVANRGLPRLEHLRALHDSWAHGVPLECHHVPAPELADRILTRLPPGSLVVNATGLGKDRPGSPLTDQAIFPQAAFVWDFNYRGKLVYLEQAWAQKKARKLHLEDGWVYFLHGWTSVIADVFDLAIPSKGPRFEELSRIARASR